MASRDAAFLWETEALRATGRPSSSTIEAGGDWVTLREASQITGVPTSTLRKWIRHDNVSSQLTRTDDGYLRLVSLTGIEEWAERIGRDIGSPDSAVEGRPTGSEEEADIDLTQQTAETSPAPEVPEGSMLVPLDAWNRMLNQLGNLHEAGQQLAEARERAARAETEVRFLRERLAEIRADLERAPGDQSGRDAASPGSGPVTLVGKIYRGWRERRRG